MSENPFVLLGLCYIAIATVVIFFEFYRGVSKDMDDSTP